MSQVVVRKHSSSLFWFGCLHLPNLHQVMSQTFSGTSLYRTSKISSSSTFSLGFEGVLYGGISDTACALDILLLTNFRLKTPKWQRSKASAGPADL